MADPENHTLRLLREFRQEFREFHREFSQFRANTDARFDELTKLFAGESVLGRYAAADVDQRLQVLEKRVADVRAEDKLSALEKRVAKLERTRS